MGKFDFLHSASPGAIEHLYRQYLESPENVGHEWQFFFRGFEFARQNYTENTHPEIDKEFKVLEYITAFRRRGHLFTQTNPVRTRRKYFPTLEPENFGLHQNDLGTIFQAGKEIGIGPATLKEISDHLHETYCSSVGAEYLFIRDPEKLQWLQQNMENSKNKTLFSAGEKQNFYTLLNLACGFEQFIHKKFVGQKRFSLEGSETLIPALHYILLKGSEAGINEFILGMAHRGRLNVLSNILRKPYENIFHEFVAEAYEETIALGDVKYHLGYSNSITMENNRKVEIHLAPNPSHLEAVSPVIQGLAKAITEYKYKGSQSKVLPVLIHGDAAIAGQGVVYEVAQMMGLEGYGNGGTVHIVINNQVGFTTNYLDARSSTYCTDIGKVTKCPVFHINGDDVEAIVHTVKLALEYRQKFQSDVYIDILSYRRYGHNEGDEPRYSQPTLYRQIASHPNPRDIYGRKLVAEGVLSGTDLDEIKNRFENLLEKELEKSKNHKKVIIQRFMGHIWKNFKYATRSDFEKNWAPPVIKDFLLETGGKICTLPDNTAFINKTVKLLDERRKMLETGKTDWALAELLAYGTLLQEGHPVRISGQDSIRGTFAHRHAEHVIEDTDKKYSPLRQLSESQAAFSVYNSPLNEYGVLGFEYGYALANPDGLTIWEAQFGDFHNVAQVIIDQYISSAEEKWGLSNGLVLFLPHGFEGQGPEHSSARIERFLSLAAGNNMHIVNPSTPANMFHLLREQVYRPFKVPLVVFTPKSLLRHPKCTSSLAELATGGFCDVIDDDMVDVEQVTRIVFCSGKIYYDLLEEKQKHKAFDIALIRVEQLHPFPIKKIEKIIGKYTNSLLNLWVQEEPINMGAWRHVHHEFGNIDIRPIGRQASGSPATGLFRIHQLQQKEIIGKVFRECTCELKRTYCGLQCNNGAQREKILKEYAYFMNK
ncbi:MAG: 2-oxoglutarate dehydrogenase E1 component [Bacteroidales bacterium]|nr:2-oxoglutarate dehydrogenase E1 component [Bacteroidales bacterium]